MPKQATIPPATPKEKKPRILNPAIENLREQHRNAVANLRKETTSAAILKGITEKLLPKLTVNDRGALLAVLQAHS